MPKIENIQEKIAKLLETAESFGDSPAADAYREKAFALSAQYGVEAAERMGDSAHNVSVLEYDLEGSYTDMQAELLNGIAIALHCKCVVQRAYNSNRVTTAYVFGKERHLERIEMLFDLLFSPLLDGTEEAYANAGDEEKFFVSATRWKRSHMAGFNTKIHQRIKAAEDASADGYADENTSGALVLVSDSDKAEEAAVERFGKLGTKHTRRQVHASAYGRGVVAGAQANMSGAALA